MEVLRKFVDIFLHLDKHLSEVIANYGTGTHIILFLIVFCETGLVVTPFLPGDSLLFAAGAFAALGSLDIKLLLGLLFVAAVLGDALNYKIGRSLGPKVLSGNYPFLKKEYLEKTEKFYLKYGGKTIIIARFVPIIRTFAPFLAGVGKMSYAKFASYNVIGGLLWVCLFVLAGYFFGNLEIVRKNFTLVIMAIIIISILPAVIEAYKAKKEKTLHLPN